MKIADLRKDYQSSGLRRAELSADPLEFFRQWFEQATRVEQTEANAMTLATSDAEGRPSARIVLLKGLDERGFHFFTNSESQKGRELVIQPEAAIVFHWAILERQVRAQGRVSRLSEEDTRRYFQSRPRGSQLGAWASAQSEALPNREELERRLREVELRFAGAEVPVPPQWSGYALLPRVVEFWQGRTNRLHDRFRYTQTTNNAWRIERLAP